MLNIGITVFGRIRCRTQRGWSRRKLSASREQPPRFAGSAASKSPGLQLQASCRQPGHGRQGDAHGDIGSANMPLVFRVILADDATPPGRHLYIAR